MGPSTVTCSRPQTTSFLLPLSKPASPLLSELSLCCSFTTTIGKLPICRSSVNGHIVFYFTSILRASPNGHLRRVSLLGTLKARGPHDGPSLQPSFFDQPHSFCSFWVRIRSLAAALSAQDQLEDDPRATDPLTSLAHHTIHLTHRRRRHATSKRPSRRERHLWTTNEILHCHESHVTRRHCAARPSTRCAR